MQTIWLFTVLRRCGTKSIVRISRNFFTLAFLTNYNPQCLLIFEMADVLAELAF